MSFKTQWTYAVDSCHAANNPLILFVFGTPFPVCMMERILSLHVCLD